MDKTSGSVCQSKAMHCQFLADWNPLINDEFVRGRLPDCQPRRCPWNGRWFQLLLFSFLSFSFHSLSLYVEEEEEDKTARLYTPWVILRKLFLTDFSSFFLFFYFINFSFPQLKKLFWLKCFVLYTLNAVCVNIGELLERCQMGERRRKTSCFFFFFFSHFAFLQCRISYVFSHYFRSFVANWK